jgi:uncharacterized membrane protein
MFLSQYQTRCPDTGAKLEGSLPLCNVRVGFELDDLQDARGQAQRNVRVGPYARMHVCLELIALAVFASPAHAHVLQVCSSRLYVVTVATGARRSRPKNGKKWSRRKLV